jgi:hypothetical protein
MNQAAQTARRSPEFSAACAAIASRRGNKIATIAIARKLLTRAWHLLATAPPPGPAAPDSTATAAHPQTGRVHDPSPLAGLKLVRPRRCAAQSREVKGLAGLSRVSDRMAC